MASESKCKLWSEERMLVATSRIVHENVILREASRLYNVPFETLRRRVNSSVKPGCKSGLGLFLLRKRKSGWQAT